MIQAALSPRELVAGLETDLTIQFVNVGSGNCTNLIFKLVLPREIQLVRGRDRMEIERLPAGEVVTRTVRVRPESVGVWTVRSTNFSYRDRRGFGCRVDDFKQELVVARPAPVAPVVEPRLRIRVVTDELSHRTWGALRGRVENIGEVPLMGTTVSVNGPFGIHDRGSGQALGTVEPGRHGEFDFSIRADDTGDVPVLVTASFFDASGRRWQEQESVRVPVRRPRGHAGMGAQPGKVNILYLAANPHDTARIRWDRDFRQIEQELMFSSSAARLSLHDRFAVQDRDISRALLEVRPNVVHFSGHGMKDGRLYLENEHGRASPVTVSGLARLFALRKDVVRCVILSSCFSAPLAQAISAHIDYVIGMSDEIDDRSAIKFSIGFYQALAAGEAIGDAFENGCALIEMQPHRSDDHAILRLFTKSQRGT